MIIVQLQEILGFFSNYMYIFFAILAFGFIIAIHELGHFLTAKAMNVKVLEFSVGMGPKIFSKQGKETLYSLRIIPFGGFCSMEGEYGERLEKDDDKKPGGDIAFTNYVLADGVAPENIKEFESANPERIEPKSEPEDLDPRSFINQKLWKRIVILAAGSVFNIIAAFIIMLMLTAGAEGYIGTTITDVTDTLPEYGTAEIKPGDKILTVNGERLYYYNDYSMFMNLNANQPVTLTLLRDGNVIEYNRRSYNVDGEDVYRYMLNFNVIESSLIENVKYAGYQMFNFMRMIRLSVAMMANGDAGFSDLAGPLGIISTMNDVGRESSSVLEGISNIIYFTAFIAVNVGIINLLPIPAMDGGRILFSLITFAVESTTRKKLDPKYENYVNTGAFALLIVLMIFILYNDILRIFSS